MVFGRTTSILYLLTCGVNTSKARSHCLRRHLHAHQETAKLHVLGTTRKWPRPRRDRDVCPQRPRRNRDVDNFSRDRDVETETTTLLCMNHIVRFRSFSAYILYGFL